MNVALAPYTQSEPVRGAFLPFGVPAFDAREEAATLGVMRSRWIGQGERCAQFERAFAEYVGAPEAIFVSSCTAGLHMSLFALGIGPGDEVITTPLTFVASVNVIEHVGATPVLADIDPATLNLDPAAVRAKITPRTKAVIGVHFGGRPFDVAAMRAVCGDRIAVVEDAAHAVAARFADGRMVGASGNLTNFSFYANKNLTTGEGGMIATDDAALAEKLRICRLHGLSSDAWKRYASKALVRSLAVLPGFKYNATDMQAALGLVQLEKLEAFQRMRETYAALYDRELAALPALDLVPRPNPGRERHALHLYAVLLRLDELACDRDTFVAAMRAENIGVGIHYDAIHAHPFYRDNYPWRYGAFPHAEHASERIISLPLSPSMTPADAAAVVEALRRVIRYYRR